ncbi:hypothetical protein HBI24_146220 [Parastagonospora nodorum]|nr:hypothetical protein HBH51_162490 [Parastagonospora nodorum]KAH4107874.1 hypothetical protein HBH46_053550 [Parastagonospora nodorum]KAH4205014.1 hypothetical protein HBI95_142530 [Parastagonospora nodorum]KAH4846073.1 hypothetical protein HBH75_175720 [Parastagonospora nodorum]KAH4927216.1 hypothetical protein HBI79_141310 [Parastagonospora nodorum]
MKVLKQRRRAKRQNISYRTLGDVLRSIREDVGLNSHTPLLRLPAEIRNEIYDYTFSGEIVGVNTKRIWAGHVTAKHQKHNSLLALHQTCRQLRRETRHSLYTHAIFKFDRIDSDSGIAKLGREVYQAIQSVKLHDRYVSLIVDLHSICPELRKSALKGWVVGDFAALKNVYSHMSREDFGKTKDDKIFEQGVRCMFGKQDLVVRVIECIE